MSQFRELHGSPEFSATQRRAPIGENMSAVRDMVQRMRARGASWAGVARAIGHTIPDTRKAFDPTYEPDPTQVRAAEPKRIEAAEPEKVRPGSRPGGLVKAETREATVVVALSRQELTAEELADASHWTLRSAEAVLQALRLKSVVEHSFRSAWRLTARGWSEADRLSGAAS